MMVDPSPERAAWLAEHGDNLFRYAMVRLRDRARAEDAVQETFLAALTGRDRFKGQSSVRSWLVGILKHKIIDLFRRNSREVPVSGLGSADDSPEAFFDANGKWKEDPRPWRNDPGDLFEKSAPC